MVREQLEEVGRERLALEFFGEMGAPFFLAAVGVSYTVSGYTGLFSAQKILYAKSRPGFINIHTR